jgi:cytochrome c oxidase assembly protein subunit 15
VIFRKNKDISLEDFKSIWMMEWGHRMFGRIIGVAFAGPALYFAARRVITPQLAKRLGALFVMGGSQGLIGWWMVKSGLEEPQDQFDKRSSDPRVSPYRLATHLISAFTIYSFLLSTGLLVRYPLISAFAAPAALRYSSFLRFA